MKNLARQFETELRDMAARSITECNYRPSYFLQMLDTLGGVATAKALLSKSAPSQGFTHLFEIGRLDLAVEHAVADGKWAELFSAAEIRKAERWLGRK